jgi:hypothetical protein
MSLYQTFVQFCERIQNNDPTITKVGESYLRLGCGYFRLNRLLHALQGNTHVSTLEILVADEVFINLAPFLDYLRTTKTIRSITLFHRTALGDSAVGRLIRAIGANPHIEQVNCGVHPFEEFLAFLRDKAQTLKHLTATIAFNGDSTELSNAIGSLHALTHFSLGYTRNASLQASYTAKFILSLISAIDVDITVPI